MSRYERTTLWASTLARQAGPDAYAAERDRLRQAFDRFRDRAGLLAGEIPRDLPDFTVHDLTHIDALWEIASLIAGPTFLLTPAEAFVLGGAFLVHDLGLSLAAYPGGVDEVREHPLWKDTVASLARENAGAADGRPSPTPEHERLATAVALRQLHAERAGGLALTEWTDRGGDRHRLLEDSDVRRAYGSVIGLVAHSHWWGVDRLVAGLPQPLGAPSFLPNAWTVDPVKLAVLLRCADAAHLDDRRAPAFLRAVRHPTGDSDAHWVFQERLNQPRLVDERLVYTAKSAFPPADARAWWLCYETLRGVDRELSRADRLLADTERPRLAARAVANVDDARRLATLIRTADWEPVDARVRVGAVTALVTALGGRELYGPDPVVPLRELVQNGADAVRARRLLDNRPTSWGEVGIAVRADGDAYWVEVSDNGVGMSLDVLSGPFLDFGASLWRSTRMHDEFPGLAAKGFEPTGRFGIGFFSVFMWGGTVQVRTRHFAAARADTWVLEFSGGLAERPLLRRARPDECLQEGGTIVRVRLEGQSPTRDVLEGRFPNHGTVEHACARLCATADVNVRLRRGDNPPITLVEANDWLTMDGALFLERVAQWFGRRDRQREERVRQAARLRVITDQAGRPIGRACLVVPYDGMGAAPGAVCVGGFVASPTHGIAGVLLGAPTTATRQEALPFLRGDALAAFVTDQVHQITAGTEDAGALIEVAKTVWHLGGNLGTLPVAWTAGGLVNTAQLEAVLAGRESVVLAGDGPFQLASDASFQFPSGTPLDKFAAEIRSETVLREDVVLVRRNGMHVLSGTVNGVVLEDEWLGARELRPVARQYDPLVAHVIECAARAWGMASADDIAPHPVETDVDGGVVRGAALTAEGYRLGRPASGRHAV